MKIENKDGDHTHGTRTPRRGPNVRREFACQTSPGRARQRLRSVVQRLIRGIRLFALEPRGNDSRQLATCAFDAGDPVLHISDVSGRPVFAASRSGFMICLSGSHMRGYDDSVDSVCGANAVTSTPALARSHYHRLPATYLYNPANDPNAVFVAGTYAGSDPDPNIRSALRREFGRI